MKASIIKSIPLVILFGLMHVAWGQKGQVRTCPGIDMDTLPELKRIVGEIAKGEEATSHGIGEGGALSKQWARYEKLKQIARPGHLKALTNHPHPAVRCYAFQAMSVMHYAGVFDVLLDHVLDTAMVRTQFGCIGSETTVADYMIDVVTPGCVDHDCYKLNSAERKILDSALLSHKFLVLEYKFTLPGWKATIPSKYKLVNKSYPLSRDIVSYRMYENDSIFTDYGLLCQSDTSVKCAIQFRLGKAGWFVKAGNKWQEFFMFSDSLVKVVYFKEEKFLLKPIGHSMEYNGRQLWGFVHERLYVYSSETSILWFDPQYGVVVIGDPFVYIREDYFR